jgi:hypothetical protein
VYAYSTRTVRCLLGRADQGSPPLAARDVADGDFAHRASVDNQWITKFVTGDRAARNGRSIELGRTRVSGTAYPMTFVCGVQDSWNMDPHLLL